MKLITLSTGLFILIHTSQFTQCAKSQMSGKDMNDFNLTTVQIIEKYGYPAETHTTVTEDGYILELHRIPHGKNSTKPGFPILAGHSLLCDSSIYVLHGEKSLGFFLADEGYDVWLLNFRGNHYTRTHKNLSPDDSKFWDFSLHEFGVYDLPAGINYICNHTKHDDILYLGHSMGSTSFFIFGSERPEYQKNIRGAALLGPVAILKYSKAVIQFAFVPLMKFIEIFSESRPMFDEFQDSDILEKIIKYGCNSTEICTFISFLVSGYDSKEFDERTSLNLASHVSSTSSKVLEHFAQLFVSSEFEQYDYGAIKNVLKYNSLSPPKYHLESITIPLSLFEGINDIFATPQNTMETTARLSSVKSIYVARQRSFNHLDYLFGKHVKETIYPEIAKRLNDFLNNNQSKILQ